MFEKDLNHDLVSLFNREGWSWKIPDPDQRAMSSGGKRPFDGVAFFKDIGAYYFESKLIKNKLQAFSLDRIEEHQYENLLRLRSLGAETALILGFWASRKDYWFMCFDPLFLSELRLRKKSILAKELQTYIDKGYTINLRHTENFRPAVLLSRRIDFFPGGETS